MFLSTAPPPPPANNVPYIGDRRPSKDTITVFIPPDLFNEVFGKIAYYAIIVAEGVGKCDTL